MHKLKFKSNKTLRSLAKETLNADTFKIAYKKETTDQKGFFLVKDEGIYLMDAYADKHPDSYNKRVIYASGFNPKHDKHGDLWDRTYAISRDDFGEFIPMDEDALYRILKGGSVKVRITDHHLEVKA